MNKMSDTPLPLDRFVAEESSELIDLRAIGRAFRKHLIPVFLVSILALAATAAAYFLTTPSYLATATMVVERQAQDVIPVETDSPALTTDSPTVDTTVEILQSPFIAGRVVDALKLVQEPEFNPALLKEGASPPTTAAEQRVARDRAIRILGSALKVQREGVSYAIAVRYTSENPKMAANIANATIDEYLLTRLEGEAGSTQRSADLLETRLEELRGEVLAAEAQVAQYRSEEGLFAATDVSSITQQELSVLNNQLAEARAAEAVANSRLATARSQVSQGLTGESLGAALESEVVGALRSQRATASAEVANLTTRYGPRHPSLIEAQSQLADIDVQIGAEVERIVASLNTEATAARGRTASIASSIAGLQNRLAVDSDASVRLSELERNAASARELYQGFLDRYKESVARQGTETSGAKEVSRAAIPAMPISPNPLLYIAVAFVAAGACSTAVVAGREFMENGLRTAADIEKRLQVSALGSIPEIGSLPEVRKSREPIPWPPQFLIEHPKSAFAEAFRALKTSLVMAPAGRSAAQRQTKIISITSALPGEGKTSSAICLASAAARSGIRTLLVDCDSRRQASSRSLAKSIKHGLTAVLNGEASLQQAIVHDEDSGTYFLGQKPDEETPFDLMGSQAMTDLLEELRGQFQFVVLDTAPVLPVAESRMLAALADLVLFLVQWKKTPAKAAEIGLHQLDGVGANIAGVVLSRVDVVEQARTGFGDAGLYFKQYKEYYA
ncbi:polysaccharide biosynthesis tyrosine autokinase [Parasphingorhabdus litoris]|uniref:non-specific protein-tyrosine kinase n=1 Tax=Parasphingorhabdus litoris TaxID=394733 RepID=A0ABP3K9M7_9SPHN|nr:AAA family ATPase [Parasphingorhabdus litoris]